MIFYIKKISRKYPIYIIYIKIILNISINFVINKNKICIKYFKHSFAIQIINLIILNNINIYQK